MHDSLNSVSVSVRPKRFPKCMPHWTVSVSDQNAFQNAWLIEQCQCQCQTKTLFKMHDSLNSVSVSVRPKRFPKCMIHWTVSVSVSDQNAFQNAWLIGQCQFQCQTKTLSKMHDSLNSVSVRPKRFPKCMTHWTVSVSVSDQNAFQNAWLIEQCQCQCQTKTLSKMHDSLNCVSVSVRPKRFPKCMTNWTASVSVSDQNAFQNAWLIEQCQCQCHTKTLSKMHDSLNSVSVSVRPKRFPKCMTHWTVPVSVSDQNAFQNAWLIEQCQCQCQHDSLNSVSVSVRPKRFPKCMTHWTVSVSDQNAFQNAWLIEQCQCQTKTLSKMHGSLNSVSVSVRPKRFPKCMTHWTVSVSDHNAFQNAWLIEQCQCQCQTKTLSKMHDSLSSVSVSVRPKRFPKCMPHWTVSVSVSDQNAFQNAWLIEQCQCQCQTTPLSKTVVGVSVRPKRFPKCLTHWTVSVPVSDQNAFQNAWLIEQCQCQCQTKTLSKMHDSLNSVSVRPKRFPRCMTHWTVSVSDQNAFQNAWLIEQCQCQCQTKTLSKMHDSLNSVSVSVRPRRFPKCMTHWTVSVSDQNAFQNAWLIEQCQCQTKTLSKMHDSLNSVSVSVRPKRFPKCMTHWTMSVSVSDQNAFQNAWLIEQCQCQTKTLSKMHASLNSVSVSVRPKRFPKCMTHWTVSVSVSDQNAFQNAWLIELCQCQCQTKTLSKMHD